MGGSGRTVGGNTRNASLGVGTWAAWVHRLAVVPWDVRDFERLTGLEPMKPLEGNADRVQRGRVQVVHLVNQEKPSTLAVRPTWPVSRIYTPGAPAPARSTEHAGRAGDNPSARYATSQGLDVVGIRGDDQSGLRGGTGGNHVGVG
jgi:hypothetical protein